MKTFRQIADENNKDRTTIFKRAKKIPDFKKKHMMNKNHKWYIDSKGEKLLINYSGTRPKRYHSRINTKYDYWKRAKFLEDQNKWLRSRMDKLIAKLDDDEQVKQLVRQLANHTQSNQKQLTGQKSRPQTKINEHYHPEDDVYEQKIMDLKHKYHKAKYELKNRPVKHQSFWQWIFGNHTE